MYSASHDCVWATALIKNPPSMITHEDTDLRGSISSPLLELSTLCFALAASVPYPAYLADSKTAMLLGTRFLVLIVIIVAIHNRSDHRFCMLHAVFVQHACHISCSRHLPNGVTVSQVPCTHVRLGGTGSERMSDFHGEILLHLTKNCKQL